MTTKKPVVSGWRNRIVGTSDEAPDQLLANPRNYRRHPAAQRDALRGSLGEIGWVQQVLVNKRTGFVLDGHARIEEALSHNEPTVPVLWVDLSDDEERLVLATLDPLSAMATTDADALNALLDEIKTTDAGLLELLNSLRVSDMDVETDYEPSEASGRGLSHLALIVPTDEFEFLRARLIEIADTLSIEGIVDERMGRAAIAAVREYDKSR